MGERGIPRENLVSSTKSIICYDNIDSKVLINCNNLSQCFSYVTCKKQGLVRERRSVASKIGKFAVDVVRLELRATQKKLLQVIKTSVAPSAVYCECLGGLVYVMQWPVRERNRIRFPVGLMEAFSRLKRNLD